MRENDPLDAVVLILKVLFFVALGILFILIATGTFPE
jgi:hypothetical protein